MAEGIDPTAAIGDELESVNLSEIVNQADLNSDVEKTMSTAVTNAIENAAELPGGTSSVTSAREDMTNSHRGEFGDEKDTLLSDVERPGANSSKSPEITEIEAFSQSIAGLMHDLTTWQVTWGVAQNAQKDLSHILKSS